MIDVLSELREAEATILRMHDAATPLPWFREETPIGDVEAILAPHPSPYRDAPWRVGEEFIGADSALIVLSVSVLVEVALPIIQDAIKVAPYWGSPPYPSVDFDALRLARFVNERSK